MRYNEAINSALHGAMEADSRVICYGLGVPDPKGVFGTTRGLQERFGVERVFDMPTAENGMTGVGIGAALTGTIPVMVSQRLDFYLLAMDQLVNAAAKWCYMFGGKASVPFTIRLIIGRGWGQGPTHSQNLQSWFAHIPGLKVVMPTTPYDAKGLLLSSIFDPNPVVFLEHRWLYNSEGDVPEGDYREPLGKARVMREGQDVTVVSMSYMTVEALRAVDMLRERGISAELIDLRTVSPIDWPALIKSVQKTGRLVCVDTGHRSFSCSAEIVAGITEQCWSDMKSAPERVALPDVPTPTSPALTRYFYPGPVEIARAILKATDRRMDIGDLEHQQKGPYDVPGEWFKGPF